MTRARLILGVAVTTFGCQHDAEPVKSLAPPAQVRHAIAEDALTTVQLTAQAIARLGIATEPVTLSAIARARQLGGQATLPPGRAITVRAAVAGHLAGAPPQPGDRLRAGSMLFELTPLMSPDAHATLAAAAAAARGAAGVATARHAAANSALARAEQVLREGAGSARAVEEARAERDAATAALQAASAQHEVLTAGSDGPWRKLTICAPIDGMLTQLHALPDIDVPAGAALFEITDDAVLWIEVPVYVGDLPSLDTNAAVRVGAPGAPPAALTRTAQPVQAPPTAKPDAATASLFYVLDNKDHGVRPGERLGVRIPRRGAAEQVPSTRASAIVFDANGGTWVYERVDESTFARRRVEVRAVEGGQAILARGPAPGTQLVTVGAAELFGAEFFETK